MSVSSAYSVQETTEDPDGDGSILLPSINRLRGSLEVRIKYRALSMIALNCFWDPTYLAMGLIT